MMRRLLPIVLAFAMIGTAACGSDSDSGNNAGAGSSATTAQQQPDGHPSRIKNSGLGNPFNPCQYVDIETANVVKDPSVPFIVMNHDYYSPTRNVPVRQCVSNGDEGARLTVTVVRDKPGDDTAYNAFVQLYPSRADLDASKFGMQKGFFIRQGAGTLGMVIKTKRDTVAAFKFGSPVQTPGGLDTMVTAAVVSENRFYDEAIRLMGNTTPLPQPTT